VIQRRYFDIIVFCNPVYVKAFALCGGDEIMISLVNVRVSKESPNAHV
jgi:hypothetical protein